METLWFWLVAGMIAGYVVLDGFDLGAGAVHLLVAKNENERRQVLASIGPVWDGNEVWLLAAGGTLYFAFPGLYASSFSGFYLPLMIVLWLLILRGTAIEFRDHLAHPMWRAPWDVVFPLSSALLIIFYGAALGNVIRGVPLDAEGVFFLPLWTDFGIDGQVGILDWYTILVGLFAFVTVTRHGALWLALKVDGPVQTRSRRVASVLWWCMSGLLAVTTVATLEIQPQLTANLSAQPAGYGLYVVVLPALLATAILSRRGDDLRAFLASCAFIAGMLVSAAFGVFPYVLPSVGDPGLGLTIFNSSAGSYGLGIGLAWWIPGMLLATGYFVFVYRHFAGKVGGTQEER